MQENQKKEATLSRPERRLRDHANEVHSKLMGHYTDFFIKAQDPLGKDTELEAARLNAQWRLYCRKRNFKPFVYDIFMDGVKVIRDEYIKELPPELQAPAPPPDVIHPATVSISMVTRILTLFKKRKA